jgi:hypothetical protein
MLKKLVALTLLAAALSNAGWVKHARVPAQTSRGDTLIVGVFRPDGVIVPFARYAKRKWTNPWHSPQPDAQPDEPDTIADLPKPWYESFVKPSVKWYLSPSTGDASTVRTSKNIQVCSHCQQVWGVLSDYPNPQQPEKNTCPRNLGIALSKKKQTRVMEQLPSSSADWKQMMTFLGPEFERAEKAGISAIVSQQYAAQLPSLAERTRVPPSLLNLYRSELNDGGQVLFYFEVSKEYPKPRDANDPGCNNISLLGGWVIRNTQGKLTLLDSRYSPTDCDWKEGGLVLPFAVLLLDGKKFVIVDEIGYEGESYTILEIRKDSVRRVLETYGGSC